MSPVLNSLAIRQIVRWCVPIAFVCLSLLYLISDLYSAWVSSGPPNPYPLGWSRRAAGHLCFSGAALLLGLGLFLLIRTLPKFGRGALVCLVLGLLLLFAPYVGRFVLADHCLDQGGSWSNQTIQCSNE